MTPFTQQKAGMVGRQLRPLIQLSFLAIIPLFLCTGCLLGTVPSYSHGGEQYVIHLAANKKGKLPSPPFAVLSEHIRENHMASCQLDTIVSASLLYVSDSKFAVAVPQMMDSGNLTLGSHLELLPMTCDRFRLTIFAPGFMIKTIEIDEIQEYDPAFDRSKSKSGGGATSQSTMAHESTEHYNHTWNSYYRKSDNGDLACRIAMDGLPTEMDVKKARVRWRQKFSLQLHLLAKAVNEGHLRKSDAAVRRMVYDAVRQQAENAAFMHSTSGTSSELPAQQANDAQRAKEDMQAVAKWAGTEAQ